MELKLISGLEHQQIAVDKIAAAFAGVAWGEHENWQNPALLNAQGVIEHNLRILQNAEVNNIPPEHRNRETQRRGDTEKESKRESASSAKSAGDKNTSPLNLDIKMETGTGKTYVYTKAMHELHKRYGVSKFVLAVPTLAIKAGARQFLSEGYVRNHFASDYAGSVELCEVKPQGAKKGSRKIYPQAVREFVEGNAPNKIYVLLLNMQLLTNAKVLTADDYDRELFGIAGSACPADAVRRHFETERANFARCPRIKTLALFFINDIVSYRGDGEDASASSRLCHSFNIQPHP